MTEVLVFISNFILIFLLGLQGRFVRDSQYFYAAFTSLCLGVAGYYTTMQIAIVQQMFTSVYWAYLAAGPVAITCSIWVHDNYFIKRSC